MRSRVRLAFFAERRREEDDRFFAAVLACLESEERDAAERPFFLSALDVARDLRAEGLRAEWLCPLR